jgi:ribosomal-protein-alanine N-acetyltransferase
MKLSNVLIKTDRLLIREFQPSDWKDVNDYARLKKTTRYLTFEPNTPTQTKAFLKRVVAQRSQKPRTGFDLAIVLENKVIGGCAIRITNKRYRETYIGYGLHPSYWGNGYATEAARSMVNFGFNQLKMHRIAATCDIRNKTSENVLKKCGLQKEGCLHSHLLLHGRWRTSFLYAILESNKIKNGHKKALPPFGNRALKKLTD